jgi:hypothetical protein
MAIPINWLAILACGIASMIIGFLWYGPLFGKTWAAMMSFDMSTPDKVRKMQRKATPGYIASFIAALVMAYVLAHDIYFGMDFLGTFTVGSGMQGAFWNWLGLVVPVTLGKVFWESKPWKLWAIDTAYWLVAILVMGAILSAWPA